MKKTAECKRTAEIVNMELDGRISTGDMEALNSHIAKCEPCRKERESLLGLRSLFIENFTNIDIPGLPADFNREFYIKLAQKTEHPLVNRIKELLSAESIIPGARALAALAVILIVSLVSINQFYEKLYVKPVIFPAQPAESSINMNSNTLFNLAEKETQNRELRDLADRQAKQIISIAGIRG